jgi:hypothetical protein
MVHGPGPHQWRQQERGSSVVADLVTRAKNGDNRRGWSGTPR